jgi:hypothetical protein
MQCIDVNNKYDHYEVINGLLFTTFGHGMNLCFDYEPKRELTNKIGSVMVNIPDSIVNEMR